MKIGAKTDLIRYQIVSLFTGTDLESLLKLFPKCIFMSELLT